MACCGVSICNDLEDVLIVLNVSLKVVDVPKHAGIFKKE
jgi:hypothetical protein